jgi:hypothetical protein
VRVAVAARLLAVDEHHLRDVDERRERRREQVDLDVRAASAALAAGERREHADRGVAPGQQVRDGDADLRRPALRRAGDRHQPGARLREQVEPRRRRVGAGSAESGHGRRDEPRVRLAHRGERESEALEHAGREVLDDDVRARRETPDRLRAGGTRQVERDRLLVAIDAQVVRGHAAARVVRRPPGARHVALGRVLHLDDAGAEVGEEHRAERPREDAGEVQHEHARERRAHGRGRG